MKMLIVINLLFLNFAYGTEKSVPCKILRTDNIILHGQCIEIENKMFFWSCADFTCRVNPTLSRKPEPDDPSCGSALTRAKFISKIKKEHADKSYSDIRYCLYSE